MCGVCLAVLVGCGGGSGDFVGEKFETAPVSGVIKVDGTPFAGLVEFVPNSKGGRIASDNSGSDGSFTMGTYDDTDGVVPGEYKVQISVDITSPTPAPAVEDYVVTVIPAGTDALEIDLKSTQGMADPLLSPNP